MFLSKGAFAFSLIAGVFSMITQASASSIVNGDFSTAVTTPGSVPGFSEEFCPFFCGPDTLNASNVATNGSDPYLEVSALAYSLMGSATITVSQGFTVMSGQTLLSFDAGITGTGVDGSLGQNTTLGIDSFTALLKVGGNFQGLFLINETGASLANTNTVPIARSVTANAPGAFFSHSFTADLSGFVGQSVELFFSANSRPDLKLTDFGVDNVALGALPPVVPLPAGGVLLITGLLAFRLVRKS
jgi:hypothetical protein